MFTKPAGRGRCRRSHKGVIMTKIYCGYLDCENLSEGTCHAGAIRLSVDEGCENYHPPEGSSRVNRDMDGDSLLWDREYFEDDPIDDEVVY